MSDSQEQLDKLQKSLQESADHFASASSVWNSIGLDSPQFSEEAARVAKMEYQKAADLLEPNQFTSLSGEVLNRILANREQALAYAAYMESFLYDEQSDAGLQRIIDAIGHEIDHIEKESQYIEQSNPNDPISLSSSRERVLDALGRRAGLMARLANRQGKLIEARDLYKLAEEKFRLLMGIYENQTPELVRTKDNAREIVNRTWHQDDEREKEGIRWTAIALRTPEQSPPLPNEDLYRRAASNYYSSAASRSSLDALGVLNNGGSSQDAEKKLEESIEFVYCAMEIFPGNLEFHQDLFDAWRVRGELFGCPMEQTEKYYLTRCPLAIMHFIGAWYVSPTLEYESLACTICGKDILECPHYPGQVVDNKVVRYKCQNIKMPSVSLVDVPEDPRCRIEWIPIPKSYFPPPPESGSEMRCFLCKIERDNGNVNARLIDLPDWIEENANRRYNQIARAKRYRTIEQD